MVEEPMFEWNGAGYDAFPDRADLLDVPPDRLRDGSTVLRAAIARARRGSFELVSRVAREIIGETDDFILHHVACDFVADAGSAADLETLVQKLSGTDLFLTGLHLATGLTSRGRLADIPAVFGFYERYRKLPDTEILRLDLNILLCEPSAPFDEPSGDEGWAEYRAAVAARYFGLWNEFGTNLIHIYYGRPFEIGRVAEVILSDIREGILAGTDRRLFEVTTGISCSEWFTNEKPNFLQAAADVERFMESGIATSRLPGQRAFMGHPLEDVRAAGKILAMYPPNRGLDVPEVRAAFDVDTYFELPLGFDTLQGGYFVRTTQPPPSAELTVDKDWPWLSLHTCLREAMAGNRAPLEGLSGLLRPDSNPIYLASAIDLIADAADDRTLAPWREMILQEEDPRFTCALCWGLLERGILRDVPLVLEAYRRNADHPDYAFLDGRFNNLFAFRPVRHGRNQPVGFETCQEEVTRRYDALCRRLGRDDLPIFRGDLFSVQGLAREIIELRHGPDVTVDLRQRFEASTGINCSDWEDGADWTGTRLLQRPICFSIARSPHPIRRGSSIFSGGPLLTHSVARALSTRARCHYAWAR